MIDRSIVHEDCNAVRFEHPFLPLVPLPQHTVTMRVDNAASYQVSIPQCAFFTVQNGGELTLLFSVSSIDDESLFAVGDEFHGGMALGMGVSSPYIYAGNVRTLDLRAVGGETFAVICCYMVN